MSLFRRGRGLFKFLFVIDDFFRKFAMTLLIPLLFYWLKFPQFLITLGVILGMIIDIHDFMEDAGFGKVKR